MSIERASWYNPTGDEDIIWNGNPSLVVHAPHIVAGMLFGIVSIIAAAFVVFIYTGRTFYTEYLLLAFAVLSFMYGFYVYIRIKNIHYVITTNRVIRKTGIIGTNKYSKHHDNIVRIDVNISPMVRILNKVLSLDIGDIVIRSADDRGDSFRLSNVTATSRAERLLDDLSNTNTNIAAKYGTDTDTTETTSQTSPPEQSTSSSNAASQQSQDDGFENPDPYDSSDDDDDGELDEFEPSSNA